MKALFQLAFALVLVLPGARAENAPPPTIVVRGPTIVAFFVPVAEAELEKEPDTKEALADFQVYAERTRRMLQGSEIHFEVISAATFKVQRRRNVASFRPKQAVGYYFVMPGKRARVEYGVRTHHDIQAIANVYFAPKVRIP